MTLQEIKINETRNIILMGTALISGIEVEFAYNVKKNKFVCIAYDVHTASGIFPEGSSREVPQKYLVGRLISEGLQNMKNN